MQRREVKYKELAVTLVDTVGWPDTDQSKAQVSWDDNVENVINRGLNALVWIVKADRGTDQLISELYRSQTDFMVELMKAKCDVFMVINGTENFQAGKYRGMQADKLQEEKERVRKELEMRAESLKNALGIHRDLKVYAAIDIEDFQDGASAWLLEKLPMNLKYSALSKYQRIRPQEEPSNFVVLNSQAEPLNPRPMPNRSLDMRVVVGLIVVLSEGLIFVFLVVWSKFRR